MKQPAALVILAALTGLTGAFAGNLQSDKAAPIAILNARGDVVPSQPATPSAKIVDVDVGPNFSFTFSPSAVTIVAGDTVRWTWKGSNHTVTSGSPCTVDNAYCSPNDPANCTTATVSNAPTVYSHIFTQAGTFSYFCRIHCGSGMTGTVTVLEPFVTITSVMHDNNGFTINGKTTPNTTISIKSAPNLATQFQDLTTTMSNGTGDFSVADGTATSAVLTRFYRASYP